MSHFTLPPGGSEPKRRGGSSVERRFSHTDDGNPKQLHPHLAEGDQAIQIADVSGLPLSEEVILDAFLS